MSFTRVLSWFGRKGGPFLVPVEVWSAIVRGGGQGRPSGRRVSRLALEGRKHGRTLAANEMNGLRVKGRPGAPWLMSLGALAALTASSASAMAPIRSAQEPTVAASVSEASARFGIAEAWIYAVMRQESGGDPNAVSPKGAMGLLQLMPTTWSELTAELNLGEDPFAPRANILAGAAYLRRMYDRFGAPGFLAAYNAGPARYERYLAGRQKLPVETQVYVRSVGAALRATAPGLVLPPHARDWRTAPLFVSSGELTSMGERP